MRVRGEGGHPDVVITVVEHGVPRPGARERWVLLDERGHQSSLTFHTLPAALEWAAWTTLAWRLWEHSDDPFCR